MLGGSTYIVNFHCPPFAYGVESLVVKCWHHQVGDADTATRWSIYKSPTSSLARPDSNVLDVDLQKRHLHCCHKNLHCFFTFKAIPFTII